MSVIYEKWRDLDIDPFKIKFENIKIKDIVSYPPAQNDVIECICEYNKKDISLFIKIERSKVANFDVEITHLKELEKIGIKNIPNVIEYGKIKNKDYIVLSKVNGKRLSDIFKENISAKDKQKYLLEYGRVLADIHNLKFNGGIESAKQRKINSYPKKEDYKEIPIFLEKYIEYLENNEPIFNQDTFIHGDFHYANILWNEFKATGLLDWEYSGFGFKEQDIAWSCILRSTQYFMDNIEDIKYFLKGYLEKGNFNFNDLRWCLINGYCHFYLMNLENEAYKKKLEKLINDAYVKLREESI